MGAPGSSQQDPASTFLRLPALVHAGGTPLLRRDALKQVKALKALGNVSVKKLETGKLDVVTTQEFFSMTLLLFCKRVQALERKMS